MVFCISENIFLQWPWDSQHGFKLKQTRNILTFFIKIECRKHHSHFLLCPLVSQKKPQNKWKAKAFLTETLKNQFSWYEWNQYYSKTKIWLKLQQKKSLLHCGIFISINDQKDDKFENLLPYVSTNTDMMSWFCYLKYNTYPF